jgi:autotransporter translocation and assembly factor TamB
MGVVFRYLGRFLAIAALAFLVVSAALIVFTRTATFNRLVQARLAPYLATAFKGAITIGSIEGSLWGDLELRDVRLRYQGTEALYLPRAVVGYSLLPLLSGTLHLRIAVFDPLGEFTQDRAGNWNLLEALGSRETTPPTPAGAGPALALTLDAITVSGGVLEAVPADGRRYRLLGLETDLAVVIARSGVSVRLRRLATTLAVAGKPSAEIQGALTYEGAEHEVDLSDLRVKTARSQLAASGVVGLAPVSVARAHVTFTPLAAADVAAFFPSPLRADLSGSLSIEGPAKALHAGLTLAAAGAAVDLTAQADITAPSPAYSVALKVDAADLKKLLRVPGLSGVVRAELAAQGAGWALGSITGHGRLAGRDLLVAHRAVGTAQLDAQLAGGDLRAEGNVNGPAGAVMLEGNTSLDRNPKYKFKVTVRRLDYAKLGPPGSFATNINLDTAVDGRGLSLATLDNRVVARLLNSQVAGAVLTQGSVDTTLVRGRAQISRAAFAAEDVTLALRGNVGLAPDTQTNLDYELHAASFRSLLKRAGLEGGGSLTASGNLRGPTARLRTRGTIGFAALHAARYAAAAGQIRYDLEARRGALPAGSLQARITALDLGVKFDELTLAVSLPSAPAGRIAIELNALDAKRRSNRVVLALDYRPPQLAGRVEEAMIALPDGTWRLVAPVIFTAAPPGVTIGRMRLQNGDRSLALEGSLGATGNQDFSFDASQIDATLLSPILPQYARIAGNLMLSLRVTGSAAQPLIDLRLAAAKMAVDGRALGDLSVQSRFAGGRTTLAAEWREPRGNAVTAGGTLSANLNWVHGVHLQIANDLDLRVFAARLDLNRLGALAPTMLDNFQGSGALDFKFQGDPLHPTVTGNVRVTGVKGVIVPVGVKLTDAQASIDLNTQELMVSVAARAEDGTISATGALGVNRYKPGAGRITVKFDRWPAIATQRYRAVIGGEVVASGTVTAPSLSGRLEVLNGTFRPPLEFLAATSQLSLDQTITVIAPGEQAPPHPGEAATQFRAPGEPSVFQNLTVGLTVQIDRNTWIRHDQAEVELEGRVRIEKAPQGPIGVIGAIDTVRGWITYQQRRFDLQSGTIAFTSGQSIDPTLNIDARYTLPNYLVDVLVTGTASKPVLQLKSQPELPQADILSLILFGKTTGELGQGQQQTLQQQAMQMAGGYAAGAIGQAVSQSLGLQALGLQMGGSSGSGVGFGRYFGSRTYVSASEDVTGQTGRQVSVQYFLWRWLSVTTSTSTRGSGISATLHKQY